MHHFYVDIKTSYLDALTVRELVRCETTLIELKQACSQTISFPRIDRCILRQGFDLPFSCIHLSAEGLNGSQY